MLAGWRERNCLARDVRKVRESAARVSPAPEGWMGQQPRASCGTPSYVLRRLTAALTQRARDPFGISQGKG